MDEGNTHSSVPTVLVPYSYRIIREVDIDHVEGPRRLVRLEVDAPTMAEAQQMMAVELGRYPSAPVDVE